MKTKKLMSLIGLLGLFSAFSLQPSALFAQGTAFTYQGQLTNGGHRVLPHSGRIGSTMTSLIATQRSSNGAPELRPRSQPCQTHGPNLQFIEPAP